MICPHFQPDGQGGCQCQKHRRNNSLGVCKMCKLNPDPAQWPVLLDPAAMLNQIRQYAQCKGCGENVGSE